MTLTREQLLDGAPPLPAITADDVTRARGRDARQLVVLDDDPTGTQSVADLPVLTSWSTADLAWALGTSAAAVYVMTNSRSLDPAEAEQRNRAVVRSGLAAARQLVVEVDFVSRSDSTLRGHFPLEPDTIVDELRAAGIAPDGVVVIPAFPDAGRITVGGIHYAGSPAAGYVPVGETEFARDATFGYTASWMPAWIEEKSEGRIPASSVVHIALSDIRAGTARVGELIEDVTNGRYLTADIVEEADMRSLALALIERQRQGRRYVFRVGPPFPRALIGQAAREPLSAPDIAAIMRPGTATGGLIVVGSHVDLTTRQLDRLRERRAPTEFEIDVARVLDDPVTHLAEVVAGVAAALEGGNVVVRTSRTLLRGVDGADSLRIARTVSDAVVTVVRRVLEIRSPRFVIAKGGITSSDVAARGLQISRAQVRGPMLPGIVSLWEPIAGPAAGIPYVVFAGNVGDEDSLADVADTLSTTATSH